MQLSSVHEGFQNVLLDIKVVTSSALELVPQLGKILDGFADPVISDIVRGSLGA